MSMYNMGQTMRKYTKEEQKQMALDGLLYVLIGSLTLITIYSMLNG